MSACAVRKMMWRITRRIARNGRVAPQSLADRQTHTRARARAHTHTHTHTHTTKCVTFSHYQRYTFSRLYFFHDVSVSELRTSPVFLCFRTFCVRLIADLVAFFCERGVVAEFSGDIGPRAAVHWRSVVDSAHQRRRNTGSFGFRRAHLAR